MANIKISELNELEQVDNDDLLVIVDTSANETKKISVGNLTPSNDKLVHVGTSIDSNYRTNILFDEKYNKAQVEIGKSWQGATNTKRMRFVVPITSNKDYSVLFKNNSTATINSYSIVETAEYPTTSSSPTMVVNVDEGVRNYYTSKSTTTYLAIQVDSNVDITQAIANNIFVSIWFNNPTINVDGENIYVKGQNEVYSTTEQRIGTWIDGKPLYRKVFTGTLGNETNNFITNTADYKRIVNYGGSVIQQENAIVWGVPSGNTVTAEYLISVMLRNKNIRVDISSSMYGLNYEIWVEYTKTTD